MVAKICRKHLKIADMIDFKDVIFYRRIFLLIQRADTHIAQYLKKKR